MSQPKIAPEMTNAPAQNGEWKQGFFGCLNQPEDCKFPILSFLGLPRISSIPLLPIIFTLIHFQTGLIGCIVPCFIYGENAVKLDPSKDKWTETAIFCALGYFGCHSCYGAGARQRTREKKGIKSASWCLDCLAYECCLCCALVQEKYELTH